jgi:flagellar basal-body rod protein FlgB
VQESGNTVGLAEELTKSGEIKRQYDLNTSLVSSFNRLMLMTVKS